MNMNENETKTEHKDDQKDEKKCEHDQDFTLSADVIIIGAGISGLACSRRLKENRISCIVLEARNRIGGRINTEDFSGVKVDLSASFVHGACHENPLFSNF